MYMEFTHPQTIEYLFTSQVMMCANQLFVQLKYICVKKNIANINYRPLSNFKIHFSDYFIIRKKINYSLQTNTNKY